MEINIKFDLKESEVNEPIFIAGLPGMGLTGKQAVDYLIDVFNARKIGHIEAPFLYSPVITTHEGTVDDMMNELFKFYYADVDGRDLLFFTGITQPPSPEWQHYLSYKVISVVRNFQPKTIYTLAATPIFSYKWEVNVYGVATNRDILDELRMYGVIPMKGEGIISGVNGLLIGYGKQIGIDGAVLMSETYLTSGRDYIAPLYLLRIFSRILNMEIDLKKLEDLALAFHKEFSEALTSKKKKESSGSLGYIS